VVTITPKKSTTITPKISAGEDVLRSLGAGGRRGLESIAGTPQDVLNLFAMGAAWAAGKMGASPEDQEGLRTSLDIPMLPSTEDIHEFTSRYVGESYKPQTTLGKFANTAAEFAGGSIGNPLAGLGRVGKNVLMGGVAGLASEGAGQATEGTRYEPWARAAAGLGTGAAVPAAGAGVGFARRAEQRAAEQAAEDAARRGAPGVALTKGQRTGDVSQQMAEQQMLKGGRGAWAQKLMVARDEANKRAIMEAATGIKDRTAPTRGATPVDAGGQLNQSVTGRAADLRKQGGEKIDEALKAGVMLDADRLRGLPSELGGKLEGDVPFVPDVIIDETTPIAKQAMDRVNRFVAQLGEAGGDIKEVSMAGAEALRRKLGELTGSTRTDNRALVKIRQYFDEWYDDAIERHARINPDPTALPGPGGPRDPRDILTDLKLGRATSKQGLDIVEPRGEPPGGATVADIGSGSRAAEETARLFKPNDRGDVSVQAIDALTRLQQTGATGADLDQVRGIILEQLTSGDPGKVASRVDSFIRNNPTAARALFDEEQLAQLADWGKTNRATVPDPKATNPSQSSYGIMDTMAKAASSADAGRLGTVGAILGGPIGAVLGAGIGKVTSGIGSMRNAAKAKEALAPANRDTLTETMLKEGRAGVGRSVPGAAQTQYMIVDDPGGPNDGKRVRITGMTPRGGYRGELPDGTEWIFGKHTVRPE
jgi:hypothetical protein